MLHERILKLFLNAKKLRKLEQNPKAFFEDALAKRIIPFQQTLNSLKPKKYQGYQKYAIISAVYNVEKYLDDYFKSFIHQRLDFKNNILLILVDDDSKDKSANIIAKYQKKYPKNIIYLHKENGGQASARNLGLKYLEQHLAQTQNALNPKNTQANDNNLNQSLPFIPTWVSFSDPDDFLDRDCLYQVDKVLCENKNEDLVMVACNIIFYFEKFKIYKDNHSLNFKFKENQILINQYLDDFIQLACNSAFLSLQRLLKQNIKQDEDLKPNFEDAKFLNEFLLENLNSKSAFLKEAKYFYRKRKDESSSLDKKWTQKSFFLKVPNIGYLYMLKHAKEKGKIPMFIKKLVFYDTYYLIKDQINSYKAFILNEREKEEHKALLDEIYSYFDEELILNTNLGAGLWFFHKVGILNCFKNTYPPFQIAYIDEIDDKNEQILIKYFTPDDKDIESIRFDDVEVYADYEKIVKYSFLDRVFCYEKRLWVKVPKNTQKFEIFIRGQKARIIFKRKQYLNLKNEIASLKTQRQNNENLWLLMDRDTEADDNAEHFYRYLSKNHPECNIVFALRKNSKDYERLKKEGFKLVSFASKEFEEALKKSSKIVSSNADLYLTDYFGGDTLKTKDFIFLQHGVIKDDLSTWLNKRKIDCFITSTRQEYESIAKDYNAYKFSSKEVVLTGLARHDSLLLDTKTPLKQILIMPTWRLYITGESVGNSSQKYYNSKFTQSRYFNFWNAFLQNKILKELCEQYHYQIIFSPHPNNMPHLKDFKLPPYIHINENNQSLQKLFKESALLITDYSSVAFEMAYLGKSVLYYQFDKEEFFANHTYEKGYFSYENDGFGAVVYSEEALLNELENLLKKDCKPSEPYKSRIENTFEFKDGKCCERIYEAILELDKPYKKLWTLNYVEQKAKEALEHKIYKNASERFKFILEHYKEYKQENKSFDEGFKLREFLYHFLLSSRLNYEAKEAVEFIKEKGFEKALNKEDIKLYFEFVKNLIEAKEFQLAIQRLEELNVPRENQLEFSYLKLRVYSFLGDKDAFEKVYNELKTTYNVSKETLELDLFLFQQELIKELSQPAGGGCVETLFKIYR
ncbi:MAG: CDP-glycerol glycerophosphotransferase family protein [Helicobacter sp.]|nr:CDP-glycerol glycerophosphotransferase family protein [Helicobacter sp.]